MKIGDVVRWRTSPYSIGIIVDIFKDGAIWYDVFWSDGTRNANPKWQMEVISESR